MIIYRQITDNINWKEKKIKNEMRIQSLFLWYFPIAAIRPGTNRRPYEQLWEVHCWNEKTISNVNANWNNRQYQCLHEKTIAYG